LRERLPRHEFKTPSCSKFEHCVFENPIRNPVFAKLFTVCGNETRPPFVLFVNHRHGVLYVPDQFPNRLAWRIIPTAVQGLAEFAPGKGHPRILYLLPERQGDDGGIIIRHRIAIRHPLTVFLGQLLLFELEGICNSRIASGDVT